MTGLKKLEAFLTTLVYFMKPALPNLTKDIAKEDQMIFNVLQSTNVEHAILFHNMEENALLSISIQM